MQQKVSEVILVIDGEEVRGTITQLARRLISPHKNEHITIAANQQLRQIEMAEKVAEVVAAAVEELRLVTEGIHSPAARTLNAASTVLEGSRYTLIGFGAAGR